MHGVVLLERGRWAEALSAFDRALAFWPRHARTLSLRSQAWEKLGETEHARDDLEQSLEIEMDTGRLLRLGWLYMDLENEEKAESLFRRVLELEPDDRDAMLSLAESLQRRARDESIAIYEKLIGREGAGWVEYAELGKLVLGNGEAVRALKLLGIAVERGDSTMWTILYMANANWALDQLEEAHRAFARAAEHPDFGPSGAVKFFRDFLIATGRQAEEEID